ncbi:SDR family NAD(P)-dependent oxidoreductase [Nocardia carnea]|uniref:SDR family NAD(P)-dependent oxidoreductase n=1 Tax=Nocardia carnea TaxID=37328 RepID=A0ABW7TI95_9NOCA|nr:SDR family oxidoreductase [Nocardia carnea]
MSRPLAGSGALITGGGGGFGRSAATRLARDGASDTLLGRTEATLRSAAEWVTQNAPDATPVQWVTGDSADEDDIARAVALADNTPLRICVCTVGGGTMAPVMALTDEVVSADFERNVLTALLAIRHSAAAMVAHGGGSVICLSSTAGGGSFPFMGSYSIAKAALEALVRVAADELGALGVRVNAIRPGLVPTDAAKPGLIAADETQRARVLREKPLARVGTADDIAEAVRYLAGPESSWVTGAVLPVEGGNHLRRAADLEILARKVCGDDTVDRALCGQLPERCERETPA